MRNRAALFFLAALCVLCAAALGGCTAADETVSSQPTPDLSVNISVPYATAVPTEAPADPDSPFVLDSEGRVTVLDDGWIDDGFIAVDENSSDSAENYYMQLRLGDQGQEVQALQNRLLELGYYRGGVTGVFDTLTEQAVQLFELSYGTMQTGIATATLQELLFAESAPQYSSMAYAAAIGGNYSQLQLGDAGSSVLAMQYRLQELGYPLSNASGQYDRETAAAVSLFFERYGNDPNEVASVEMQSALFTQDALTYAGTTMAPTATPAAQNEPTLSEGSSGSYVQQAQARLIELGYMQGSASGTFDAATTAGVMAFQQMLGVTQDGVITQSLYTQLLDGSAPAYNSAVAEAIRAGGYTLLEEGASGDAVTRLQSRLVELGYANGTPNGSYANATVSAVMLFQRACGLEETGVATASLQALLYAADAPTYSPAATQAAYGDRYYPYDIVINEIAEGSSGELVSYLQTRLRELGYLDGSVDGQYGPATSAAVRAVQANMGLPETGVASVTFQENLYSNAVPSPSTVMYGETQNFELMRLGDSGEMVENLQRQLWELGYLDREQLTDDEVGVYNDLTQAAVADAQLAMGYVNANGEASIEFQSFIFSQYCSLIRK